MGQTFLVREVMTDSVTTVSSSARLLDAVLVLRRTGFRHLPIVDGEQLVGIITDRDVQRLAPSLLENITPEQYNSIFEETPLERVMTKNPITVAPGTPVAKAVAILYEKKLGCLPVVENGRLVGILTVTDLLRVLHGLLTGSEKPLPRVP